MDEEDTTQLISEDSAKQADEQVANVAVDAKSEDGTWSLAVEGGPRMGCFGVFPAALQRFATPKWFLLAVSMFTICQSMVNSGLFPVIISSIERQFGFTSTQTAFVLSSYDIISAILVILVTNYGHRAHRPLWLARGMALLGIGCFLVTLPHWLVGVYVPAGAGDADLCAGAGGSTDCSSTKYGYLALFVLAQVVIATACSPLYPLGSTFIDDNVPPKQNGAFMGIFYAMGAVGPALGFLVGGLFLSVWVDAGRTTTLNQNSVDWVGAWWAPFLLAGSLAILLSSFLFLFPSRLPGMEWVLDERRRAKDKQKRKNPGEAPTSTNESFLKSALSIVSNKPYIFSQLGFTLEAVIIIGLGNFLPKIVESQFRTTASEASYYSGAVVVLGAAGGIFTGGIVSRKWSMKSTARNVFYLGFAALLTIPCFLIRCDNADIAGLSEPYPTYNTTFTTTAFPGARNVLPSGCNMGCDCSAASYRPVCGGGQTYFSACQAGCSSRVDQSTYTNCSCLPTMQLRAVEGTCEGTCTNVASFLIALFFLMFITFMINVPGTVFCMRVVAESQRSLALGLGSAIQRIGGAIPGPLAIGAILDGSCLLWQKNVRLACIKLPTSILFFFLCRKSIKCGFISSQIYI
jgi:sodium-independent organic anion transporter